MSWTVVLNKNVEKSLKKHPCIYNTVMFLVEDLRQDGPVQPRWANYSKLGKNLYHCHLKKGRPTYVAVWEVKDRKVCLIEVKYAGTHENAPY